nr:RNA-dependent RNA polymerase [Flumine noda-like virus 34]
MSMTDFEKMDATINRWWRQFEKELGLEYFAKAYHDLWKKWHSRLYSNPTTRKLHGRKINLGASRRSGEYYTSLFNTIEAFFYDLCVYVHMGYSFEEAVKCVGLVGGDDGLHADMDAEAATSVAAMFGLKVKINQVELGSPVDFLGLVRYSAGVYSYDPVRFAKKFGSVATGASVPPLEAVFRKFEPYARMYANVPIVGTASLAVLRILAKKGQNRRNAKYDLAARNISGYLNSLILDSGMLPCRASQDEMMSHVANRLGIDVVKLEAIETAYKNAKEFSDFPSHVLDLGSKEFKFPTMFQGNLYKAGSQPCRVKESVENPIEPFPTEKPNAKAKRKPGRKASRKRKTDDTGDSTNDASHATSISQASSESA